jgi:hypothetical protein
MTVELCAALAALLSAVAAASSGLAHSDVKGPWRRLVLPARAAGLVPLAVALALTIIAHGEPSPFDLRQVALGLGSVTLIIGLVLAWRRGVAGTGPVQDLLMMSLVLVAILAIQPGGSLLACEQHWLPFWIYWVLFLLGVGGTLSAGSVALDLALEAIWPGEQRWAVRTDAHRLLVDATGWALVSLGAGLSLSLWWSWRTMGNLFGGDARQTWLGATWLVVATSLLAWRSERRGAQIAAVLSILAASMALFGLLAIPDLLRLWSL